MTALRPAICRRHLASIAADSRAGSMSTSAGAKVEACLQQALAAPSHLCIDYGNTSWGWAMGSDKADKACAAAHTSGGWRTHTFCCTSWDHSIGRVYPQYAPDREHHVCLVGKMVGLWGVQMSSRFAECTRAAWSATGCCTLCTPAPRSRALVRSYR